MAKRNFQYLVIIRAGIFTKGADPVLGPESKQNFDFLLQELRHPLSGKLVLVFKSHEPDLLQTAMLLESRIRSFAISAGSLYKRVFGPKAREKNGHRKADIHQRGRVESRAVKEVEEVIEANKAQALIVVTYSELAYTLPLDLINSGTYLKGLDFKISDMVFSPCQGVLIDIQNKTCQVVGVPKL